MADNHVTHYNDCGCLSDRLYQRIEQAEVRATNHQYALLELRQAVAVILRRWQRELETGILTPQGRVTLSTCKSELEIATGIDDGTPKG